MSSAIRDITERKRIERTLNEKKLELENANLAKDRFLASMSHELRTPLNAILGFAQLLANDNLPSTQGQRKEFTNCILTAGQHLLTLINEILDLAKVESGTMSLSVEPVSVSDVIQESQAMIEPLGNQRGIRMRFPAKNDFYVLADRTRLKQAILNLLSNAIKYNREKGRLTVDVRIAKPGQLRISVQDSGSGLHADPLTCAIPVIALTANAMPHDIKAGKEAGFFRYITKPIDINELTDAINKALMLALQSRP